MFTESRTSSGARSTGCADSGMRSWNCSSSNAASCARSRDARRSCARSQKTRSTSRIPPPKAGNRSDPERRTGRLPRPRDRTCGIENRRTSGRLPEGCVRVKADEQVRFVVVGDSRSGRERDGAIVLARQQDANTQPPLNRPFDASRDCQHQVFLLHAPGALHPVIVAAVAGIDGDDPQAIGRRAEGREVRRRGGARRQRGRRRIGRRRHRFRSTSSGSSSQSG